MVRPGWGDGEGVMAEKDGADQAQKTRGPRTGRQQQRHTCTRYVPGGLQHALEVVVHGC